MIIQIEKQPGKDLVLLIASQDYCDKIYPNYTVFLNYNQRYSKLSSCLHAGRINETTTESNLFDFFNRFAVIKNIRIRKKNSNEILDY